MRRPQEARQIQEGLDIPPHEEQRNIGAPRGAETEAESSRAQGHGPHLAPGGEGNEATFGGHVGNEELRHPQQETGEQSWEQRFKSLQQDLSRVKEVVRGRAPTPWTPWCNKLNHPSQPRCYAIPSQQSSECHR